MTDRLLFDEASLAIFQRLYKDLNEFEIKVVIKYVQNKYKNKAVVK